MLYYPGSAMIRDQGPPPPTRLLAELDRRGISYQVGRVIVGAARGDEAPIREALAAAGVNRVHVYNRSALMLLPAGVSKGTGVQNALRFLGLSFHDVLAFGDAENDLPFFEVCGWRACPADGMAVLKERADWIFPGENGAAVAAAVVGPVLQGLLSVQFSARHRIPLGWAAETSEPVAIPARGVNVLVHGDPLSGKSWLAGALVERLVAARYAVCVIDPEGDYQVLSRLAAVTWAAIHSEQDMLRLLTRLERNLGASVIADLSALPHARKVDVIEAGLRAIGDLRRRLGRPHWVLLDEAHYSLHREGVAEEALGIEERGFCLVTYLPSWLRERVVKAMDVYLLSRVTAPDELAFLSVSLPGIAASGTTGRRPCCPSCREASSSSSSRILTASPMALTFVAAARETMHVRHVKKYADSHGASGAALLLPQPRWACGRGGGEPARLPPRGRRRPGRRARLPRRPRRFLPLGAGRLRGSRAGAPAGEERGAVAPGRDPGSRPRHRPPDPQPLRPGELTRGPGRAVPLT